MKKEFAKLTSTNNQLNFRKWIQHKSKSVYFFKTFKIKFFIITFALLIFNFACVTVKVGNEKSQPAKDFKFSEPSPSFEKNTANSNIDHSWISKKTKNVMGILTDCPQNNTPSLETLTQETNHSLENSNVVVQKSISFNDRSAIDLTTEGQLEGIRLKQRHILFIKNGCSYKIFYSGLVDKFASEENIFEQFIKGIQVP